MHSAWWTKRTNRLYGIINYLTHSEFYLIIRFYLKCFNLYNAFNTCFNRRVDGSLEYSFEKTLVSWLGREVTNSLSFSFSNFTYTTSIIHRKHWRLNAVKWLLSSSPFLSHIHIQWQLPFSGNSGPSGCLGVSYMDGKVWLDVRDLSGMFPW